MRGRCARRLTKQDRQARHDAAGLLLAPWALTQGAALPLQADYLRVRGAAILSPVQSRTPPAA